MPTPHRRFRIFWLPACLISMVLVSGCTSSAENSTTEEGGQSQESSANGKTTPATGNSGTDLVTTGPGGQTIIGGIPVDVWYNDPLAVVSQTGNVTPSQVTPQIAETPPEKTTEPEPTPTDAPQTASTDWDKVIPMEILDAEIKSIRNFLTPTLQSVATYNREYKQIPIQGMTMAALAQIALHHPDDALWKDKAAALRDLSYNLSNAADKVGRAPFEATTLEFEKILQIFNGSTPDLAEEPDPEAGFSDHVDRGPIMNRIDLAHRWLTSNTPAPSALTDQKEKALHEAVILGALVKVSGDKSYLFADEPNYQQHVSEVTTAVEQMRDAIATDNFEGFKEGLNVISKKCTECHGQYKDQ